MVLNRDINLLINDSPQCYLGGLQALVPVVILNQLTFRGANSGKHSIFHMCCDPKPHLILELEKPREDCAAQVFVLGWRTILLEFKEKLQGRKAVNCGQHPKEDTASCLKPRIPLSRLQTGRHAVCVPTHMCLTHLPVYFNYLPLSSFAKANY